MVPWLLRSSFFAFYVSAISTLPEQLSNKASVRIDVISILFLITLCNMQVLKKIGMKKYMALDILITCLMFIVFYHLKFFLILICTGSFLNSLAIVSNGWLMPLSPTVYQKVMKPHPVPSPTFFQIKNPGYCYTDEKTRLVFLTDCLSFKRAGGVFSLGDVVLWLGYLSYPLYLLWLWTVK